MESTGPYSPETTTPLNPQPRRSRRRQVVLLLMGLLLLWLVAAYLLMPLFWNVRVYRHPSLEDLPGITYTGNGIPGDPINVALVGAKTDLIRIMVAAKWYPADGLTLKSSLEIAVDTVLKHPDDEAPVSNLYLFGRKEDLAFEQPVDNNPRQRHHVRFWKADKAAPDGSPVWVGSAIYDQHVGLSRDTGQITHVTAADIDAERDKLFDDLKRTGDLTDFVIVNDFHKVRAGKNGGGDPWFTDGNLYACVLK
jgi:hypothetical protein